jgi:hypothetical protein
MVTLGQMVGKVRVHAQTHKKVFYSGVLLFMVMVLAGGTALVWSLVISPVNCSKIKDSTDPAKVISDTTKDRLYKQKPECLYRLTGAYIVSGKTAEAKKSFAELEKSLKDKPSGANKVSKDKVDSLKSVLEFTEKPREEQIIHTDSIPGDI